jgi:hypothetical protein
MSRGFAPDVLRRLAAADFEPPDNGLAEVSD